MSAAKRGLIGAAAVIIVAGGAYGVVWVSRVTAQGPCVGRSIVVDVAASPDIAPAVQQVATAWNATSPKIEGECVSAKVTAVASADIARLLAARVGGSIDVGDPPASPAPDAAVPALWIPDSASWIPRVRAVDGAAFAEVAGNPLAMPSVAVSPVVIAIRAADRSRLALAGQMITPAAFMEHVSAMRNSFIQQEADPRAPADRFQLGIDDPRHDATGLAMSLLLTAQDASAPGAPPYGFVVEDFRAIGAHTTSTQGSPALLDALTATRPLVSAVAVSEQAVIAYNATAPGKAAPLDAVGLTSGLGTLDYPAAIIGGLSGGQTAAAQAFQAILTSPAQRAPFVTRGFRAPDGSTPTGFPDTGGSAPDTVKVIPIPVDQNLVIDLQIWSLATTPARILALVDVGSSMALPSATPGLTRLGLIAAAAHLGLNLFIPASQVGLSEFAPGIGPDDTKALVNVEPLDENGGQQLVRIAGAFDNLQVAGGRGCALLPALVAAYKQMRETQQTGHVDTIVVFTDCAADAPGLDLATALTQLQQMIDVTHQVPIVIINVGLASVDDRLGQIIDTVGGSQPFHLTAPQDILGIFMRALVTTPA